MVPGRCGFREVVVHAFWPRGLERENTDLMISGLFSILAYMSQVIFHRS